MNFYAAGSVSSVLFFRLARNYFARPAGEVRFFGGSVSGFSEAIVFSAIRVPKFLQKFGFSSFPARQFSSFYSERMRVLRNLGLIESLDVFGLRSVTAFKVAGRAQPNQTLEPTPTAVTFCACAQPAPAAGVAHL
jgi:hypothetical protein